MKAYEAAKILSFYMRPATKIDPLQFYTGWIRKEYLELQRQLAAGEDLEAQNQWLRRYTADLIAGKAGASSHGGSAIDEDLNAFLFLFGATSRHYPGRLEADVEKAVKEYVFSSIDDGKATLIEIALTLRSITLSIATTISGSNG